MITSSYAEGNPQMVSLLERAVNEGHELANHMPHDRPYHKDDKNLIEESLVQTKTFLDKLTAEPSKWFRAPSGALSTNLINIVEKYGYTSVLGDCYSFDPDLNTNSV